LKRIVAIIPKERVGTADYQMVYIVQLLPTASLITHDGPLVFHDRHETL